MKSIRKITKVKRNTISFNELKKYNDAEVEVIVRPISKIERNIQSRKKNVILKFAGIIKSGYNDTSHTGLMI